MKVRDLTEEQLKVGFVVQSCSNKNILGTIINVNTNYQRYPKIEIVIQWNLPKGYNNKFPHRYHEDKTFCPYKDCWCEVMGSYFIISCKEQYP